MSYEFFNLLVKHSNFKMLKFKLKNYIFLFWENTNKFKNEVVYL